LRVPGLPQLQTEANVKYVSGTILALAGLYGLHEHVEYAGWLIILAATVLLLP
jgi:hypothetical protein